MAIGVLVDGEWFVDPSMVKNEFFTHFSQRFSKLDSFRIYPFLEQDIMAAVNEFFTSGTLPRGCNCSFITLILKIQDSKVVDFEKAFALIRYDYLEYVLKMFGFGNKWGGWINGCLNSAMGSVLVNGSLTSEFQFHKGLKQGDPLSPLLFIMLMDSLHLSFRRVMNAGLFSGIFINGSLMISNLFYADDVVFIGK
ncbi:RNA-directed DNA polymerase, eukaryota [Tanacetum coccineum]